MNAKTKTQLKTGLVELRQQIVNLKRSVREHKGAEDRLRESEERLKAIIESVNDVIFQLSPSGLIKFVSPNVRELYGYKPEELIGKHFKRTTPMSEVPKALKALKTALSGNTVMNFEINQLDSTGNIFPMEINITPLKKEGKIIAVQGIMRDITSRKLAERELLKVHDELERRVEERTAKLAKVNEQLLDEIRERKRMEEALKSSEERLKILFKFAPDAYYLNDLKGNFIDGNIAAEKLIGYKKGELIRKNFFKLKLLSPGQIPKATAALAKNVLGQPSGPEEFILNRKDGTHVPVEIHTYTVKIKGKTLVLGIARNISERKKAEEEKERLQEQLNQSEKMAAIGTLSSGIAHEFNNLLQIMSGHVQIARRANETQDMEEAFDIVLSTTDRATNFIRDLLTFSRTEGVKKELCNIKEPLEVVLSLTEDQLKKNNINVVRDYKKTSDLKVNKGEMQQVFLNIVTNARDAMLPKGGRLGIDVRQEKGRVKVSFHDTGKGIKKEDVSRVFEPFLTTKGAIGGNETIAGSGLGLSVSYGIVKRHGGIIEVVSEKGKGSTFTICLPVKVVKKKKKE